MATIIVNSDYDGYFERLVKSWYAKKEEMGLKPNYETVRVSAGPYRSSAVTLHKCKDGSLSIDFYSAIRTGFGSLSTGEVNDIITNWL